MLKYVLKRIAYMIIVFFTVSFLMYALYNLIPEDPARMELEPLKTTLKPAEYQARYEELRQEMGLDDPLVIRYARWMGLAKDRKGNISGLLQGDFGYSRYFKKDIIEVVKVDGTALTVTSILSVIIGTYKNCSQCFFPFTKSYAIPLSTSKIFPSAS